MFFFWFYFGFYFGCLGKWPEVFEIGEYISNMWKKETNCFIMRTPLAIVALQFFIILELNSYDLYHPTLLLLYSVYICIAKCHSIYCYIQSIRSDSFVWCSCNVFFVSDFCIWKWKKAWMFSIDWALIQLR